MRNRILAPGVVALTAALALAGCANSTASSGSSSTANTGSSGEIHVLDVTGTSGSTSIFGIPETNAMKAAAAYYNAQGGILGKKVVIDVVNDNSDPSVAVSLLTKELSTNPNKYTMVWAGQEGTVSAALTPLLSRYNVFATAVNDGNTLCRDASKCPNFFPQAGTSDYAELSDTNFLKAQGFKKVGILANEATYTQSELGFLKTDLDKAGIKYEVVNFPDTAVDVTPEMTKLKNDGVDGMMALALGPTAGYTLKARQSLNWDVPLLFDITGSAGDLSSLVPASALKGVSETIQWCMDTKNNIPAFDLMNQYTPQPLPGNIICPIPGDGWGGIVLLAEAAKKANSLDPAKLVAAANGLTISSNEVSYTQKCWTAQNHDDPCQDQSYYEIVPAGQLKGGRLSPLS
jgi:branched-chain amino acid transport system substrate-binding protein